MASCEREEKGNQGEPKGWHPIKRETQRNQKGAKMKKAHPKAHFAEQERNNLEKGCEKDANVCQTGTKMDSKSMPKEIKNQ